jgi:hypothetical protein
MHWSEVAREQPRLAAMGLQRLSEPGVVLVGTIRRDGTPRISPVEPLFWVDIADVTFIRYDEPTGDQFVSRWPPAVEYVRRGDSATSLGEPEAYADLLRAPDNG